MNKYAVSKKPHFICNHLIISKISCFEVKASWWICFKDVSLLSDLYLALNVDYLLDYVTGLVGFFLIPESDESSNDVLDESSEDIEDEESGEILIYSCAVCTCYYYFACFIAAFESGCYSGTCCSLCIQASILACFFCSSSSCAFLINSYSLQASS